MVNPERLQPGERLWLHDKRVTVIAVNRFWRDAIGGHLICGAVMLQGDPTANDPRSLHTFCKQARRHRR